MREGDSPNSREPGDRPGIYSNAAEGSESHGFPFASLFAFRFFSTLALYSLPTEGFCCERTVEVLGAPPSHVAILFTVGCDACNARGIIFRSC